MLTALRPRLLVYALSMTRDRTAAEDLVQETSLKVLIGQGSFKQGTNFAAWAFRIQRNEFISGMRKRRDTTDIDGLANTLSHPPMQERSLRVKEMVRWIMMLPIDVRRTLLMAGDEVTYERIAALTGTDVGTVKSRISRARDMLVGLL